MEINTNPFTESSTEEEILSTESEIHQMTSEELDETTVHEDEHESHETHTEDLHCSDSYTAILDNRFASTYCTLDNFATALIESGMATAI